MLQIDDNLEQKIENDGFVIVKNVLSNNEVRKLRKTVKEHFRCKGVPANSGLTQPNAAVEVLTISWLLYHPKILGVIGHWLRQEEIMFTSYCAVHKRTLNRAKGE